MMTPQAGRESEFRTGKNWHNAFSAFGFLLRAKRGCNEQPIALGITGFSLIAVTYGMARFSWGLMLPDIRQAIFLTPDCRSGSPPVAMRPVLSVSLPLHH
jgi:hypothetical protein